MRLLRGFRRRRVDRRVDRHVGGRKQGAIRSGRRLQSCLETLEARQLLAGDATLALDEYEVRQNGDTQTLNVLANDEFSEDYDGAREISSVSFGSQGGRIEISEDRKAIEYAPPADFAGLEKFSYFVDGQYVGDVDVLVQSPLEHDDYELNPDGQVHQLDVLANDPFWDDYAGPREISLVSVTSNPESEVEIAPDGKSVLYRSNFFHGGTDRFLYIVDGHFSANVRISTPLVVKYDEYELFEDDEPQTLHVMSNDPFWRGYDGAREITFVSESVYESGATIAISASGREVIYTPAPEFVGNDSFRYAIDGRYEASVSVYVHNPTRTDHHELDINSTDQPIDVISNDYYYSRFARHQVDVVDSVTDVDAVSEFGGSIRLLGDGLSVVYSAPAGFEGRDSFFYVADGRYEVPVYVSVTRPVRDDYLTVYQDTPNQSLPIFANDFLGNGYTGPQQLTSISEAEFGGLEVDGDRVSFTPADGMTGTDRFHYAVDGDLDADVSLYVQPLAISDHQSFCTRTPNDSFTVNVFANDNFRRGYLGPAEITAITAIEADGTLEANGGNLIYRPGPSSWDRFEYTVDGKYTAEVSLSRYQHLSSDTRVVDQNSDLVSIPVLNNDFLSLHRRCSSTQYVGPRQVSGVSESTHGGTVRVGANGRSVEYAPPTDFFGTDHFSYIVDGTMEQSVTVHVVRRVRDDHMRAAPNAAATLDVLVNDLFGADYSGAQQISSVPQFTEQGGGLTIGADGRTVVYQPGDDFMGTDSFEYTVDGRYKATVTIEVQPDGAELYPQFDSLAEFEQFLIDDAVDRYAGLFGQPAYERFFFGDAAFEDASLAAPFERDFSETNVQVEGVDEADLMEFDADYLYMIAGNDMVILDAWPAEQLHEVSRVDIEGNILGQYLNGDRITVVSQRVTWFDNYPFFGDILVDTAVDRDSFAADSLFPFGFRYTPPVYDTIVTVIDVTDRAAPSLVQKTTLEGRYVQSRAIGDFVYVSVTSDAATPPSPLVIYEDPENPVDGVYETEEQYLARMHANLGEFIDETLPNYTSENANGEVVRTGLLHEPEDIYRPLSEGASALVSLASINVMNSEPGLSASSGVYTNGATEIYASLEHFFVFESGYDVEDGNVTRILQFDWDRESGAAKFSAAGEVAGLMLNQFSADEYDGHLRIVTTITNSYSGNFTRVSENDLFVLRDDGGVLEFTGSMQNLALNESAQSVRFMGDRAFLVTFRDFDPLFGLDVSDPTDPRAIGHLTLPGFSSYMQLIEDDFLLTVGQNTPGGRRGPTQVSLFNVSDLAHPELVEQYTFERFSRSEAEADHHAFGYYARHGLLAVPSVRNYVVRTDEDGDGFAEMRTGVTDHELMVLKIDVTAAPRSGQAVVPVAQILHDSLVRRSGYIDDYLFSIANDSVNVVHVDQPDVILATAQDLIVEPEEPPVPEPVLEDARLATARLDLAAQLSIGDSHILPVVVEPNGGRWNSVLRVGERYYAYAEVGDNVQLIDDDFQFRPEGDRISLQNGDDVVDVNADGHVAPSDAMMIINELTAHGSHAVDSQRVLRQIDDQQQSKGMYLDVNGDGFVTPLDALMVANRLNETSGVAIDTGSLDANDPTTVDDVDAVEDFFAHIQSTAGDSNLDGKFDSSDLVQVFQRGLYEDDEPRNATWEDGDWDGDRDVTTADLVFAFVHGTYE